MKKFFLKNKIFYFLFLIFIIFIFPKFSFSASLYFSPSSGSYDVNQSFTVNVLLESSDQAMNAVSGIINFPVDKLEVISLSKVGSILNLWVQEPSFSNNLGTINFEGVVLNPGFQGSNGKILTITFKAKSSGQANLNFGSASILANDGLGTSILKELGRATFDLKLKEIIESKIDKIEKEDIIILPIKPNIYSLTHQDQNVWYSNNNVILKWDLPKDILALKYSITKNKEEEPNILIDFPFNSKEYKNLEDGIWYFNLQFKNKKGWSEVVHYKIQIDTASPEIKSFELIDGYKIQNNYPEVLINVLDNVSGIDYFEFKIGDGDFYKVLPENIKNNIYVLPYQAPGNKILSFRVYDKAGNYSFAKIEFEVLPKPTFFEILSKKISITLIYLIPLIALIILLIILVLYGIRYIILLRKKIKKEKNLTFEELHQLFNELKEEIEYRIKAIKNVKNKKVFTKEEEEVINAIKEDLEKTEKIIKKDLTEIFDDLNKD